MEDAASVSIREASILPGHNLFQVTYIGISVSSWATELLLDARFVIGPRQTTAALACTTGNLRYVTALPSTYLIL